MYNIQVRRPLTPDSIQALSFARQARDVFPESGVTARSVASLAIVIASESDINDALSQKVKHKAISRAPKPWQTEAKFLDRLTRSLAPTSWSSLAFEVVEVGYHPDGDAMSSISLTLNDASGILQDEQAKVIEIFPYKTDWKAVRSVIEIARVATRHATSDVLDWFADQTPASIGLDAVDLPPPRPYASTQLAPHGFPGYELAFITREQ